ncbi:RNA polymerase-binding protein RbpA [Dermatophilus congolensis]|uniref:RNA polymerase-binding protein RbpA n=1 Tax=Dermatophilus congolensis TaxID=1863 RepID=A0A239VM24_9MICO|nr:RNA polymerase-binding protein RbpA [Dermatophilus congolensis]MBO3129407.1 RNA polymerase-binding protein RbpA [Dermatophilus congolensis]MBO3131960.1 RNA polymerase-binding protein RbpA [Dermatophilus congolensis]MBO3133884.1 RNA polymerase-binding protein RbpA [Dermatophilus congolensis]MBO3136114.1 RNA polymerase-binding protein RbpA [Dermatophilus congolensis]MBO3138358.1 RNA polymerase-binding protein RbpA [Dermatophilus congolensis]
MAERSLRGTNLSALSMETDENVVLSERRISKYECPNGHISELPFSIEADIPPIWECRCGQEAKLADGPDPEHKPGKHVRTHWDMLLERRSEEELAEVLIERVNVVRARRGEEPLTSLR